MAKYLSFNDVDSYIKNQNQVNDYNATNNSTESSNIANTGRIVNIVPTKSSTAWPDWRHNLSNLLGSDGTPIVSGSDLDTNKNIVLLMNDESPEISTGNGYDNGISKIFNSSGSTASSKSGKYANMLNKVLEYGKAAKGAIESFTEDATETSSRWNPWFTRVPTWTGIDGIEFPYKFEFAIGQYGWWNAREEVVKPILNLIAPTLPQVMSSFYTSGPAPQVLDLIAGVLKQLGDFKNFEDIGKGIQNLVLDKYNSFTYTVSFGNFVTISNCLIKDSKWKFSSEVDALGFPIKGSVDLTFKSIVPIALNSQAGVQAIKFGGNF